MRQKTQSAESLEQNFSQIAAEKESLENEFRLSKNALEAQVNEYLKQIEVDKKKEEVLRQELQVAKDALDNKTDELSRYKRKNPTNQKQNTQNQYLRNQKY